MTRMCPDCGSLLDHKRSTPDHRRFFALIRAAAEHWPEHHSFQPEGPTLQDRAEHLRTYLLVWAGHKTRTEVAFPASDGLPSLARVFADALEVAIRQTGGYAFVVPAPDGGSVAVYGPKSISYQTLNQPGFAEIRDRIEKKIEDVIGVHADELLRERAA